MHRISRLTFTVAEQLYIAKRCFSVTQSALSWNPVRYSQNFDLGYSAFRVYAVNSLLNRYPDLSARDVNDLASGLTNNNHISQKVKDSGLIDPTSNSHDVIAKIGELKRNKDDTTVEKIFEQFEKSCLTSLSETDTVQLIKSQHPKFLLRRFCDLGSINLYTSVNREDGGLYNVAVSFEMEIVATAKHERLEEAEHLACLAAIKSRFLEQYNDINLNQFEDIPLESIIDIGKEHLQRTVTIQKTGDEEFGFSIRGGQQKASKDDDYAQIFIITPILVSHVKEGSVAEAAGLRKADQILGVCDHSLVNKSHEQAAISIRRFLPEEEVTLTVIHNKHEFLKFEAEQKILERDLVKVKAEVESKNLSRWHQAKARIDPIEYFMEKFTPKKRKVIKRPGGENRLWC